MGKIGEWYEEHFWSVVFGVIAVAVILMGLLMWNISQRVDAACQRIGFESAKTISVQYYCADKEGNLQTVEMKEPSVWHPLGNYTARVITIGDIRTVPK